MTPSQCPNQDVVRAFGEGGLDQATRDRTGGHLNGCSSCTRILAAHLTQLTAQFSHAPGTGGPAAASIRAAGDKFGRYVIVGDVGQGGMGAVYAAYDTTLDRKVALKVLNRSGEDAVARLLAEASVMAKLNHPNVVTVYDFGVHDGQAYLAMELVEGQTLGEWRARGEGGRRSLREIVTVMAAAARGLAAAHAAGIVHRDVKPSNILVDGARVLVTDFGLSVPRSAAPPEIKNDGELEPSSQSISGTPSYMAPEQWNSGPVDARTDVFAFCVTFYQMLYGVLPFAGETLRAKFMATMAGRVSPPPAGHKVPQRLHRLALAGLAVDPDKRPVDMIGIADSLLADPAIGRRRTLIAATAVVAVGLAFWGGGYLKATPERRCQAGAAAIDGAWNEGRRTALGRIYQAVDEAAAWQALRGRLDRYSGAWRAMHAETCSATFSERRQSEAMLDLRMVCLDGRRAALDAFVAGLVKGSPAQLVAAAGARLPDLAECGITGHANMRPLPSDPGERAQVNVIEADIAQSHIQIVLGDYARARQAAVKAVTAARKLGYDPALAHALAMEALVEIRAGGTEEQTGVEGQGKGKPASNLQERLLEEAIVVAEKGGDDLRRASAAAELVMAYVADDRFREAELWAGLASSLLDRLGNPADERMRLELNVGWLREFGGQHALAHQAFGRSLALARKGPEEASTVSPFHGFCISEEQLPKRLACLRENLTLAQRVYGPNHSDLGIVYTEMADVLRRESATHAEACALLEKARKINQAALPPGHPALLGAFANLAQCLADENQPVQARQYYDYLLAHVTKPGSRRGQVRQNFGLFLWNVNGDLDGAIRYLRLSAEDRSAVYGDTHERTVRTRRNLAEALRKNGQPAQALAEVDAIIAACAAKGATPPDLVDAHAIRGEALADLGRYREAEQAARVAIAMIEKAGPPPRDRDIAQSGALSLLGRAQQGQGHAVIAASTFERVIALQPPGDDGREARAESSYFLARVLLELEARGRPASSRVCTLAKTAVDGFRASTKQFEPELRAALALWGSPQLKSCRPRS
jgi:tetratricopeptide (TPR) repeat protein/predicted Ser/Thr protein kinase